MIRCKCHCKQIVFSQYFRFAHVAVLYNIITCVSAHLPIIVMTVDVTRSVTRYNTHVIRM